MPTEYRKMKDDKLKSALLLLFLVFMKTMLQWHTDIGQFSCLQYNFRAFS